MKVKWLAVLAFALVIGCGFNVPGVSADGNCGGSKYGGSIEDKIHDKAMMLISSQDELSLSETQVKKIRDLKHSFKKEMIRKDAEIAVLGIDIESAMWEDPIDTAAVDKLIDSKYELKKAEAKAGVAAYAQLQEMLTKEQKDKLKAMVKARKKAMLSCPMMHGAKGAASASNMRHEMAEAKETGSKEMEHKK